MAQYTKLLFKLLNKLWMKWNLRATALFSLAIQIFLIFSAPRRKRDGRAQKTWMMWSAYLLADYVATYCIGLISNNQGIKYQTTPVDPTIAAFWAPFLLLHLGGPDTITSFAIEDNELWLRHMLGVVVQVVAVCYVIYQTLSLPNNEYLIPSLLVFVAGIIKYCERTRALYLACLSHLRKSLRPEPEAGPSYAQLMEEFDSNKIAHIPVRIGTIREAAKDVNPDEEKGKRKAVREDKNREIDILKYGYESYKRFRGLVVDHMFSFQERNQSRKLFFALDHEEAFGVMAVELNFLYDELFTKMAMVHRSYWGYPWRFICYAIIAIVFVQFYLNSKANMHILDKAVSYALLVGAMVLDLVAFIMLVFSDWTVAISVDSSVSEYVSPCVKQGFYSIHRMLSSGRRWYGQMSQFSFLEYCLKPQHKRLCKFADVFGLKDKVEEMVYKESKLVESALKKLIFSNLKDKAERAKDRRVAKEIYSARGDWSLLQFNAELPNMKKDMEYDESVLIWHVATGLCYHTTEAGDNDRVARENSKLLSEYLLYLLVMRPMLMAPVVGILQIRFQDTCAETEKFFEGQSTPGGMEEQACKKLLSVKTVVEPAAVKGDRSKSVLFDACMLANDLLEMEKSKMWEMISNVWVELLSYGASRCRGDAHAQHLTKGGELVTFVWLLMAHFGLGDQFRIEAGHARAKLIVDN